MPRPRGTHQLRPAKLNSRRDATVIPSRYHVTRMTDPPRNRRLISRRSLLIGGSGLLAAYAVGCRYGSRVAVSATTNRHALPNV